MAPSTSMTGSNPSASEWCAVCPRPHESEMRTQIGGNGELNPPAADYPLGRLFWCVIGATINLLLTPTVRVHQPSGCPTVQVLLEVWAPSQYGDIFEAVHHRAHVGLFSPLGYECLVTCFLDSPRWTIRRGPVLRDAQYFEIREYTASRLRALRTSSKVSCRYERRSCSQADPSRSGTHHRLRG